MTKRHWLPKAPPYRAPTTRARWPIWVGVLTACFLVAFFIGRRGSTDMLSVWDQPVLRSPEIVDVRSVAIEPAGDAVRQAMQAMRNSCDLSADEACAKP